MNFRELLEENLNLKDLIKILNEEGYSQYKSEKPNRMHEYHNKGIIVSMASDGRVMTVFKVRDYDKQNEIEFTPKSNENFRTIIRNRSLKNVKKILQGAYNEV